jgi:hypothetical protein
MAPKEGHKLDWKFELLITTSAGDEYEKSKRAAEAAVEGYGPLPLNRDTRLQPRLSTIHHFERTQRLLRSIQNPQDVSLDQGLFGSAYFVRYRAEHDTCVYFTRYATTPPIVLVYALSSTPLDHLALRKLFLSGNAQLIEKLGLPPIPTNIRSYLVN